MFYVLLYVLSSLLLLQAVSPSGQRSLARSPLLDQRPYLIYTKNKFFPFFMPFLRFLLLRSALQSLYLYYSFPVVGKGVESYVCKVYYPFFPFTRWCSTREARPLGQALLPHFTFPLLASFLLFIFVLKNQMGLTLKNRGTADDLHNTQKRSPQQQSHPTRVCLQTRNTILITSISGRSWLFPNVVGPDHGP